MKAPAPPPPKVTQVKQEKVLSRYNAIVYVHEDKIWKPLYDKYTSLVCCDYGGEELNERYCLNTFVGQERVLQYHITSSTKVKIKESFVRCQNDRLIVGARFKSDEVAKNYHQQLLDILSDITPYAKVNKNLCKGPETLQKQHSKEQMQNEVIQNNEGTASKKEILPIGNGISKTVPITYDARRDSGAAKRDLANRNETSRDSASNGSALKKDTTFNTTEIRRGSSSNSNAVKKDTSAIIHDVRRGSSSNNNTVKNDTVSNINDIRRGSAPSSSFARKDCSSNVDDMRRDSASSNSSTRRDSANVNNARKDLANIDNVRRESASNGSVTKREYPAHNVAPKGDSISKSGGQTQASLSAAEDRQAHLSNTDDPIWRVFLGLANLQSAELSNPRVSSIVKNFVLERGGDTFLRQVNDQKVSARLVDDLNSLAGQVHAITEQPTHKPPIKPDRTTYALRQTSQPGMPYEHTETATLDRRAKNKRRAPPPPVRSKSLQNLLDDDVVEKTGKVAFERAASVSGKSLISSPAGKRKAPAVPADHSPLTAANKKHDSEFPHFVAPPPPSGPPPDESIGSPVGPLSPESAGIPAREVGHSNNSIKSDLTEEHNAVAQLDMVICAEENKDDMNNDSDNVFSVDDPGTPIVKRNGHSPIVGKTILVENESCSGEAQMQPLNIETKSSREMGMKVDAVPHSPPQNGSGRDENLVQLQLQQQLLALQEQVSHQEQMLLAAGLLKKKDDEAPASQPESNPPVAVTAKIEVNETASKPLKQNAIIVSPEIPHCQQKIEDVKDAEMVRKPPPVTDKPRKPGGKNTPATTHVEACVTSNDVVEEDNNRNHHDKQVMDEVFVDLDLPPPPPELLEDTIIASPIPSLICQADEERFERIIDGIPRESTPIAPSKKGNVDVVDSSKIPIPNGKVHSNVDEEQSITKVTPPQSPVTSSPVSPKITTEPQVVPKSSSPSLDSPTALPVTVPGQPGLPKKPMSGLYAKLKARTAAKGGKMPLSTAASTNKTSQIPVDPANSPPKVDATTKPKVAQSTAAQGEIPKGPVPPVGLGSMISSEPITIMRRDQLKISDPSTKVRREPLKISEPISSMREPPRVQNDESGMKDTTSGILSQVNEKTNDAPVETNNIQNNCGPSGEPETTSVSPPSEHTNEPVQGSESDVCESNNPLESKKVNEVVEEESIPAAIESEPVFCAPPMMEEFDQTKCTESIPVANETGGKGGDGPDATPTHSVSSIVPIEAGEKVDGKTENGAVLTGIPGSGYSSSPNNQINDHIPQIKKAAYTNSQLNEVQSKGYQRISFNGSVDVKCEDLSIKNASETLKPIVENAENINGTCQQTVFPTDVVKNIEVPVNNNIKEVLENDSVGGDNERTISEPCVPVIDKGIISVTTNGDSLVMNYNGAHSDGSNDVASNGDSGDSVPTSATAPPPKKVAKTPPPAPKPKPLYKSNSTESPEAVFFDQTAESAKDRMIRNIQERGTPYDERGLVDQTPEVLPSQHVNAITNTNNKIIEPTPLSKSVEVLDKTSPLFQDVRGMNSRGPNKPPPAVKPKPKSKPISNNSNIINESKPATFMRHVSEEPGSRQTTNVKTIGSLNIGFARDSSRDVLRTMDVSTRGSLPKKEPPKTLPKNKIYRSPSTDSTSSTDSSVKSSELSNGSRLSLQSSIDIDLRSTSVRNENPR